MNNIKKKLTILVTDGENRSSLAVTRSLGKAGCRVVIAGKKKKNLSSCSRYCTSAYQVPSPIQGGDGFLRVIKEILIREKVGVIYPMTEPAVMLLSKYREQLPVAATLACPTIDKIKSVFNKFSVFKLAQENNVAIPATLFIENRKDFNRKKTTISQFPLVAKPAMSRIPTEQNFIATSVKYANNIEELTELYNKHEAFNYPSLIQEKIIGPGTGLFTLFDKNHHLALFSHKRLREKPPSGGVSVVCESCQLDKEMVESARRLLAAVGWQGVAMVEFKRDERDGKAKLMEINGRFWGSLQLAISAGIDFPTLLLKLLQGERQNGLQDQYQIGLKMKWLLGTLDHMLIRLRNPDLKLNLPTGYPSKLQTVVDFMKLKEAKCGFDVLQISDFKPFLHELSEYVTDILSSR
ncbi:ATP-grasp domain-containing protein [Desulfobacterota bacterium M19]